MKTCLFILLDNREIISALQPFNKMKHYILVHSKTLYLQMVVDTSSPGQTAQNIL